MAKFYAGYNGYGVQVSYGSLGWQFLAFDSRAARDAYVEEHCYNRAGNVVCEAVKRDDIPGINNSATAIVKSVDYPNDYPDGCIGEIRDRYIAGYDVVAEL